MTTHALGEAGKHIMRVMMMANGDSKWDLSPNDIEAIKHVLQRMRDAEDALKTLARRRGCGVGTSDCACCISARDRAHYIVPLVHAMIDAGGTNG